MIKKKIEKESLFKSIFTAYVILLLHVVLVAGIGVTVVLFRGVYLYLPWIMGGIGILVLAITYVFYRKMKHSSSDIRQILSLPEFANRTVEIKLLGGLASFKVSADNRNTGYIEHQSSQTDPLLLQDSIQRTESKILELTALYEKNIITKEEFEKARQDILQG